MDIEKPDNVEDAVNVSTPLEAKVAQEVAFVSTGEGKLNIQQALGSDDMDIEKPDNVGDAVTISTPMEAIAEENAFVLDGEGNLNIHRASSVETTTAPTRHQKIVAKYSWRAKTDFNDQDDSGSSSSDDDFDEEFKNILNAAKLCPIIEDRPAKPVVEYDFPKLDKDYYQLPDLSKLSLTCLDSLIMKPFGTVYQHYDSLVIIKPREGLPFLNMDTMLFDSNRQTVGLIYELMGLLECPFYNILFTTPSETEQRLPIRAPLLARTKTGAGRKLPGVFVRELTPEKREFVPTLLPIGTELFFAPEGPEEVTKYLIVDELERGERRQNTDQEGCSSSDEEDPEEKLRYEKLKKELQDYENRKNGKRMRKQSVSSVNSFTPSTKKPNHFGGGFYPARGAR